MTCDISEEATLPLGFRFQERVQTPKGVAYVIGVARGTHHLYFRLENEEKASFWSSCVTKADFQARGFVVLPDTPEVVDPKASHRLKRIEFNGEERVIVMQSVNGPCPIIALANCLSLQGRLSPGRTAKGNVISSKALRHEVIAYLQTVPARPHFLSPPDVNGAKTLRYSVETATKDDLELFTEEKLKGMYDGLNVSPFFHCVDAFEADANLSLFGVAGVRLLHSWIIDAQDEQMKGIRERSYLDAVAAGTEDEGGYILRYLEATAVQSTDIGIRMVTDALQEKEVAVLFMNNHFSTIVRINSCILQLVTDEGYADKRSVVFQRFTLDGGSTMLGGEGSPINPLLLEAMQRYGDAYRDDDLLAKRDELVALAASEGREFQPSLEQVIAAIEAERKSAHRGVSSSRAEVSEARETAPQAEVPLTAAQRMVEQLIGMGFPREDCERVAATHPSSVDRAIERLLA